MDTDYQRIRTTGNHDVDLRRRVSLESCARDLRPAVSKLPGQPRACCQLVKVWPVDSESRQVIVGQTFETYLFAMGANIAAFVVARPSSATYAVLELLAPDGKQILVRLLVRVDRCEPAIRGMYSIVARILERLVVSPEGAVFHRSHFAKS